MIENSGIELSARLFPFRPMTNDKRSIEFVDKGVRRVIKRSYDISRFHQLINVYKTLQTLGTLGNNKGYPYLQTVTKMEVYDAGDTYLDLILNPIGNSKIPKTDKEAREWLHCMMTALKHWHGLNYCHGDIRWPNIIHVQTQVNHYWVLIDVDESYHPNIQTIDWEHPCRTQVLTFQHDLYQLGCLLSGMIFELSKVLTEMKAKLLSSIVDPCTGDIRINKGITAEGMLIEFDQQLVEESSNEAL